jgi:hypothetical protein
MINVLISALIFVVEDEVNSNCTNTATPSRAHGTFIGFILVSLFLFYLHCYCLGEYIYSEASTPCSSSFNMAEGQTLVTWFRVPFVRFQNDS